MALAPEQVVNKQFHETKFRDGYDQDEVDDFLDEVVVELRRLHQENEDLRQQAGFVEAKVAEVQQSLNALQQGGDVATMALPLSNAEFPRMDR